MKQHRQPTSTSRTAARVGRNRAPRRGPHRPRRRWSERAPSPDSEIDTRAPGRQPVDATSIVLARGRRRIAHGQRPTDGTVPRRLRNREQRSSGHDRTAAPGLAVRRDSSSCDHAVAGAARDRRPAPPLAQLVLVDAVRQETERDAGFGIAPRDLARRRRCARTRAARPCGPCRACATARRRPSRRVRACGWPASPCSRGTSCAPST